MKKFESIATKMITITIIASIVAIASPAAADFIIPPIEPESYVKYEFGDESHSTIRCENRPAETEIWTNPNTGETEIEYEEQRISCNGYGRFSQDDFDYNIIPVSIESRLYRWDNKGCLEFEVDYYFLQIPKEVYPDWTDFPSTSSSYEIGNDCISAHSSLGHAESWEYLGQELGWISWQTEDVEWSFSFGLDNAICTYMRQFVYGETEHWNGNKYNLTHIGARFEIQYTGDAQGLAAINNCIAMVPEPTTMTLLTIGALAFIRRRR